MNPRRDPPTDDELDRLLGSRYRDTSPEFEARWRDLRRGLRTAPAPRRRFGWPAAWTGLAVAAAALAVLFTVSRPPEPPRFSPAFAELLEMDEVLAGALPLLDAENRDALLHLPPDPPPRT